MYVAEMSEIFPFSVSKFAATSIAHTIDGEISLISTSVSLYVCLSPRFCMNFSRKIRFTDFDFPLCTDLQYNIP